MRPDSSIQRDVEAELKWNPEVDDSDIAVKVSSGVVTLVGVARDLREKHAAEIAAKRVSGVTAVANEIQVRWDSGTRPTDSELAHQVLVALKREFPVSWEKIKPVVHDGRVFLEGTVEWNFQRERAELFAREVPGILELRNAIKVRPTIAATDIKRKIEEAFRRNAELDAQQISVEAAGSEVTLSGTVRSWAERDQAQKSAWSAPGVTGVHNELNIRT